MGPRIREWRYRHGMILRNNSDILVLAPSLILTREEADIIFEGLDGALSAMAAETGLGS